MKAESALRPVVVRLFGVLEVIGPRKEVAHRVEVMPRAVGGAGLGRNGLRVDERAIWAMKLKARSWPQRNPDHAPELPGTASADL